MEKEILQNALNEKAENITAEDEKRIEKKFHKKHRSLKNSNPFIKKMLRQLILFYQMVFDRNYHFAIKSRYIMLGAMLYFIIPIDLLSDFIPVLGYVDDAVIVKMAWNTVHDEIEKYREFLLNK